MNYFLHRITCGENASSLAQALFKKGWLSIGWSDLSTTENLEDIRQGNIDAVFEKEYRFLPRNRWNLWRFICQMQPGDVILVPLPYSFALCKIVDDKIFTNATMDPDILIDDSGREYRPDTNDPRYLYANGLFADIGFYRRIEFLPGIIPFQNMISRWDYADGALSSRMKIRQTNSDISELDESVEIAYQSWKDQKPINFKAQLQEIAAPRIKSLMQRQLNDEKMEILVQQYFRAIGATRIEIPGKTESKTEEGDADCVAFFEPLRIAILVQVKHHSEMTRDWAVDQIRAFAKNHDYGEYQTSLWVISSCDQFTEDAVDLAKDNNVRLITGKGFAEMLLNTGLERISI